MNFILGVMHNNDPVSIYSLLRAYAHFVMHKNDVLCDPMNHKLFLGLAEQRITKSLTKIESENILKFCYP